MRNSENEFLGINNQTMEVTLNLLLQMLVKRNLLRVLHQHNTGCNGTASVYKYWRGDTGMFEVARRVVTSLDRTCSR